jgi:hypothetical protein
VIVVVAARSVRETMARIVPITLLIALMTLVASCGGGKDAPPHALVVYEQSGGIAGFDDRLVIQGSGQANLEPLAGAGGSKSFRLSRDAMTHLELMLRRAGFDALRSNYRSRDVVDEIHYRITYGDRAVDADETVLPDQLRPLVHFLGEMTVANRAPHPAESAHGEGLSAAVYP